MLNLKTEKRGAYARQFFAPDGVWGVRIKIKIQKNKKNKSIKKRIANSTKNKIFFCAIKTKI